MTGKPPAKPSSRPLTDQQKLVLNYYEQNFWTNGALPTHEQAATISGVNENLIRRFWQDVKFREALASRGIDIDPVRSQGLLSSKQLLLANMLLNAHDKQTVREKLQQADVTSQQYNAWLRDPNFQNYLRKRAEEMHKATDWEAYTSLADLVRGGDINAIKLHFEMRGIYSPKVDVNLNVEVVLTRVIEIIAKHVQDPVILENIAGEIEALEVVGIGQLPRSTPPISPPTPVGSGRRGPFEL